MTDLLTGTTFYYVYQNIPDPGYTVMSYSFNNGVGTVNIQSVTSLTTAPSYTSSTAVPIFTYTGNGTNYSITSTTGVDRGSVVNASLSADGRTLTINPGASPSTSTMTLTSVWNLVVVNRAVPPSTPGPVSPSTTPSLKSPSSTTPSPGSTPWKWWVWALIALAVIVLLGGFAFLMMGKK